MFMQFLIFLIDVFLLLAIIEVSILSPLFLFISNYDLGKYEQVKIWFSVSYCILLIVKLHNCKFYSNSEEIYL